MRYEYSEELQNKPIHLTKHSGQEFDFVMSGRTESADRRKCGIFKRRRQHLL